MSNFKNIIILVLDSLSFTDEKYLSENVPLLKKYRENIINFNNVYSQSPYTEAALVSLLTSSKTLDYNGYLFNIEGKPNNINSVFKSLGYNTYNALWYYPDVTGFRTGLDDFYYIHSFSYYALYNFRIKYYIDLHKQHKITNEDMKILGELLHRFFTTLNDYIDDYFNENYRFNVIKQCSNIDELDFNRYKEILQEERSRFNENAEKYIYEVLEEKRKKLYEIKDITINKSEEYIRLERMINNKCVKASVVQFLKTIFHSSKNKSGQILFNNIIEAIRTRSKSPIVEGVLYTLNYTMKPTYEMVSCKNTLRHISSYLKENKENKNFIYNQTLDTHFPFNFFSYDINDKELLKNEYIEFEKNLKSKKTKNIFYEMSIQYCNDAIEEFIEELRDNEILEDTLIVITSDHGISYLGEVFRKEKVCTFYDENYKIPLILYNPKLKGRDIENLGSALDFLPTLLEVNGNESDGFGFSGKSILNTENKYIIYEYYGSGCPDYLRKDKLFAVKGNDFKVIARLDMQNKLYIERIFDLVNDPKEHKNKKSVLINHDTIREMISFLEDRIKEMR